MVFLEVVFLELFFLPPPLLRLVFFFGTFAPERRAHIVRTFDRLELLATDYWGDDPPPPA